MIGSKLSEQKAAASFLFLSIQTGFLQIAKPLPTPGQRQQTAGGCLVSAHCWQAPFNPKQSRFEG